MKYTFTDLKNKVVVITGGNGLLGTQFMKAFLSVNSKVVILDLLVKKKKLKMFIALSVTFQMRKMLKNV